MDDALILRIASLQADGRHLSGDPHEVATDLSLKVTA